MVERIHRQHDFGRRLAAHPPFDRPDQKVSVAQQRVRYQQQGLVVRCQHGIASAFGIALVVDAVKKLRLTGCRMVTG